jgi:hypothetical protein
MSNPGILDGSNDFEKLKNLSLRNFKQQAIWFLNAFWEKPLTEADAELFWKYVVNVSKLDLQKGKDGCEVDEFILHKFLEQLSETMTVREMRENLRETGAILQNLKFFSLAHYLIFKYKVDWHVLVNAPQGDNLKEIEEAQRMLAEVQKAFADAEAKAKQAKEALKDAEQKEAAAKSREVDAKAREAEAKATEAQAKSTEAQAKATEAQAKEAEAQATKAESDAKTAEEVATQKDKELQAAKAELEAALAELKAQEDAFNKRTEDLTKGSNDESIGLVTRNKMKNELSQHLASDPLPLRKAKITQEAAVKKADRAAQVAKDSKDKAEAARIQAEKNRQAAVQERKQAEQARAKAEKDRAAAEEAANQASQARASAEQARSAAEKARQAAAAAKQAADDAADEAARQVDAAEAYLTEVKAKPGQAQGALWWISRELHEAKAYMPERKGGYKKN